jgi:hypothetical protein
MAARRLRVVQKKYTKSVHTALGRLCTEDAAASKQHRLCNVSANTKTAAPQTEAAAIGKKR